MKLAEIEQLSPAEITEQVKKSRLELVDLRMKFASRQLDNPSLLKKKRKEIARLLTVHTDKLKKGEVEEIVKQKKETKEVKNIKIEKKSKAEEKSEAKSPRVTRKRKENA